MSEAKSIIDAGFETFDGELREAGWGKPEIQIDLQNKYFDAQIRNIPMTSLGEFVEGYKFYVSAGVIFHPKMTTLMFGQIVSHELGHLLGKGPFIGGAAVEGEADYQSPRIFKKLVSVNPDIFNVNEHLDARMEAVLKKGNLSGKEVILFSSFLNAVYQFLEIGAEISYRSFTVDIHGRDTSKVEKTRRGYPSLQARFDTVLAGILGKPRPESWAVLKDFPPLENSSSRRCVGLFGS